MNTREIDMDEIIIYLKSLPKVEVSIISKDLQKMVDIQCSGGNWNYDPYMHGMANGLIMAQSVVDNTIPKFLDAPDEWLRDVEVIDDLPEDKGDSDDK